MKRRYWEESRSKKNTTTAVPEVRACRPAEHTPEKTTRWWSYIDWQCTMPVLLSLVTVIIMVCALVLQRMCYCEHSVHRCPCGKVFVGPHALTNVYDWTEVR